MIRIVSAVLIGTAVMRAAVVETNGLSKALSLSQCVQIALEHNLDVKIARYGPEIAQHNVSLAYAAYEPILEVAGTHNYNRIGRILERSPKEILIGRGLLPSYQQD